MTVANPAVPADQSAAVGVYKFWQGGFYAAGVACERAAVGSALLAALLATTAASKARQTLFILLLFDQLLREGSFLVNTWTNKVSTT